MSPLFKKTFVLFSLTAVLFTACSKKQNDVIKEPEVSSDLKLAASATFGNVITDGTGKTLYCFVKDGKSTSTCIDGCLTTWPVYYAAKGDTKGISVPAPGVWPVLTLNTVALN
nr:hypothetical protein [Pedobacter panaciterrae]